MPDADDFDVEYFRNLLKGNNPKETPATPVLPALPATKKKKPPPGKATAARATDTSKAAGKKSTTG
jgi:hypothetical protein